jgi:hypothetical protein
MSELTLSRSRTTTRRPELPIYLAGAGLALCTFLPWLRVDFGGVFGDPADAATTGRLFAELAVATSIGGLSLLEGKVALVAAPAVVGLTWGEAAGIVRWDRRAMRTGVLAAAAA